jgi:hypothetical protein
MSATILISPCDCKVCSDVSGFTADNDFVNYDLQGNSFYNAGPLSFIEYCPAGYLCGPGLFPRTITYPPFTFSFPKPPPSTIGFPLVLSYTGCQSTVNRVLDAGATDAEINAAAQEIIYAIAQQQALCDAIALTVGQAGPAAPPVPPASPPQIGLHDLAYKDASMVVVLSTDDYTPTPNAVVFAFVINGSLGPGIPVFSGNGFTWDVEQSLLFAGTNRITLFRAMGPAPSTGPGTVTFGSGPQFDVIIRVLEFTNVNSSGSNGSGAIVQSTTNSILATPDPTLTLGAIDPSGRNAVVGFSANNQNPYGGIPKSGWSVDIDGGRQTFADVTGIFITYQLSSIDNNIMITAPVNNWGLIGVEVKAL